jgi:bifunctional UDP-N-acetylglucosamine pyrophosphorylase/glucosamine-1-phosphate N-acetyltransferase
MRIVEERDASAEERKIREINSGIYCFDLKPLFGALRQLAADNAQSEYYLTDLVAIYRRRKLRLETMRLDSAEELRGINSRGDLAELGAVLRARKNRELMHAGVTLEDPATTYIDSDVTVGADTTIAPDVALQGSTTIGAGCRIYSGCRIANSAIADGVVVLDHSVVVESRVEAGARVGPFAHLRPLSEVGEGAHVGNFVELKKTKMGKGAKANHLAYLGDATIGERANIGAGTITCNYDGTLKHPTVIEDGAFIGSDSQLIAPVRVGAGAYVAAGSSITKDVPADALAVARGQQRNIPGWVSARRAKREKGRT